MVKLLALLGAAAFALAVTVVALAVSIGKRDATILALREDLAEASMLREAWEAKALAQARQAAEFQTDAARICAVEGSSAFDRGVAVGVAVCEARR